MMQKKIETEILKWGRKENIIKYDSETISIQICIESYNSLVNKIISKFQKYGDITCLTKCKSEKKQIIDIKDLNTNSQVEKSTDLDIKRSLRSYYKNKQDKLGNIIFLH